MCLQAIWGTAWQERLAAQGCQVCQKAQGHVCSRCCCPWCRPPVPQVSWRKLALLGRCLAITCPPPSEAPPVSLAAAVFISESCSSPSPRSPSFPVPAQLPLAAQQLPSSSQQIHLRCHQLFSPPHPPPTLYSSWPPSPLQVSFLPVY